MINYIRNNYKMIITCIIVSILIAVFIDGFKSKLIVMVISSYFIVKINVAKHIGMPLFLNTHQREVWRYAKHDLNILLTRKEINKIILLADEHFKLDNNMDVDQLNESWGRYNDTIKDVHNKYIRMKKIKSL